jgi:hypothetical protein
MITYLFNDRIDTASTTRIDIVSPWNKPLSLPNIGWIHSP